MSHHSVAVCVLTPHSCGLLRAIAMSTGQFISPVFRAKTALMPQALCLLPHFSVQRAAPQSWSLIPVLSSPLGQPRTLLTAPCVHRPALRAHTAQPHALWARQTPSPGPLPECPSPSSSPVAEPGRLVFTSSDRRLGSEVPAPPSWPAEGTGPEWSARAALPLLPAVLQAVARINRAIQRGVAADTVKELMSPEAQLPPVHPSASAVYQQELAVLQRQRQGVRPSTAGSCSGFPVSGGARQSAQVTR